MKSSIAFSFVLLKLFTPAYALPTALGNLSVAVTEPQRATGAYPKGVARTVFLSDRASDRLITVPILQAPGIYGVYFAQVGFSEPVKYRRLIVDTGSSVTWFKKYVEGDTADCTGREFVLKYADGFCRADEFIDRITITPELVITDQAIGAAYESSDFDGLDGVLGLGPVALTKGKIPYESDATVPTVMNKLKSWGRISKEIFSVYFPPTVYHDVTDEGRLTFGGAEKSLYEGEIQYVSLTEDFKSGQYWGVDLISCIYGSGDSERIIFEGSDEVTIAGIIDTGSTYIYLAHDLFETYMAAIPGTTFDEELELIEIPSSSIEHMKPLHFKFGDHVFTLDVDDQLMPPKPAEIRDGEPEKRLGLITTEGPDTHSGSGLDFTLGIAFMKVYYTVFDEDNKRLGSAKAKKHIKELQTPMDE